MLRDKTDVAHWRHRRFALGSEWRDGSLVRKVDSVYITNKFGLMVSQRNSVKSREKTGRKRQYSVQSHILKDCSRSQTEQNRSTKLQTTQESNTKKGAESLQKKNKKIACIFPLNKKFSTPPSIPETLGIALPGQWGSVHVKPSSTTSILDSPVELKKIKELSPRHCKSSRKEVNSFGVVANCDENEGVEFQNRIKELKIKKYQILDERVHFEQSLNKVNITLADFQKRIDDCKNKIEKEKLQLINMKHNIKETEKGICATKEENITYKEDIETLSKDEQAIVIDRGVASATLYLEDLKQSVVDMEEKIKIHQRTIKDLHNAHHEEHKAKKKMNKKIRRSKSAENKIIKKLQELNDIAETHAIAVASALESRRLKERKKEKEAKQTEVEARRIEEQNKERKRRENLGLKYTPSKSSLGLKVILNKQNSTKQNAKTLHGVQCIPCGKKFILQRDYEAHCKSGKHLRIMHRHNKKQMQRMQDDFGIDVGALLNYQAMENKVNHPVEKKRTLPPLTRERLLEQWLGRGCHRNTINRKTRHQGQNIGIDNSHLQQNLKGFRTLYEKYENITQCKARKKEKQNQIRRIKKHRQSGGRRTLDKKKPYLPKLCLYTAKLYSSADASHFDVKQKRDILPPFQRNIRDLPINHKRKLELLLPTRNLHIKERALLCHLAETEAIPDVPKWKANDNEVLRGITDASAVMHDLYKTACVRAIENN